MAVNQDAKLEYLKIFRGSIKSNAIKFADLIKQIIASGSLVNICTAHAL